MHSSDQKQIDLINHLIGVNTNRIECYSFIAAKTDISVLQVLFSRLCETSVECRNELIDEIYKLGGKPKTGTLVCRDFFKVWLDIHTALDDDDHKAILESCAYEEDVVVDTYDRLLRNEGEKMPGYLLNLLTRQFEDIKDDSSKVNNLRSALMRAA